MVQWSGQRDSQPVQLRKLWTSVSISLGRNLICFAHDGDSAVMEGRMSRGIALTRLEHTAAELRALAAKCRDAAQTRRLLAIAMIQEGLPRLDAARQAGMDRQTLRDWVHRYNEAGPVGLVSRKPPGAAAKLNPAQMAELRELVIAGPDPDLHKVIRWRCVDLRDEVSRRFSVSGTGIGTHWKMAP